MATFSTSYIWKHNATDTLKSVQLCFHHQIAPLIKLTSHICRVDIQLWSVIRSVTRLDKKTRDFHPAGGITVWLIIPFLLSPSSVCLHLVVSAFV